MYLLERKCEMHAHMLWLLLFIVPLVQGGEPDCSFRQCYWRADDFKFGDAVDFLENGLSEQMSPGEPYGFLKPSLCKAENWRVYDNCVKRCPLALVITSPFNITMRACMTDAGFVPYATNMHVDSGHPLNEKELDLVAMADPGTRARQACELPNDGKNYTNKIVLVRRGGGCRFDEKAKTVMKLGGATLIIVNLQTDNTVLNPWRIPGQSFTIEDLPVSMMQRQMGDIIFDTLDAGIPVRGRLSLDCSVMNDPPPPEDAVPENCPHQRLLGVCADSPVAEQRLCARCAVEMSIVNTTDSPCLYSHRLQPRESNNSLLATMADVVDAEVHLADLIPEYAPPENCEDDHDFRDPYTSLSCADAAEIFAAGTMDSNGNRVTHCGLLFLLFNYDSQDQFMKNCYATCPRG
eukprot:Hpha_TRINITY_DN16025_c0_g1::TRINITY_DN16025_c0_g1_i1::g.117988::m.117988